MLFGVGMVAAQKGKPAPASEGKRGAPPASGPKGAEGVEEWHRAQLRALRESILSRTVESIKEMEEATLRVSVRNEFLLYLGRRGPAEADRSLATQMASDALADFIQHAEELPPSTANFLFNELAAWIQKHEPQLAERLAAAEKSWKGANDSGRIRALLELKGGDVLAAKRIRELLAEGEDVSGLSFYLDDFRRLNSKELEPLMSQIIEAAGRGPQIPLDTLFWASDFFLSPDVPAALRRRFAAAVVARTQPADFVGEPPPSFAYELLSKVLPVAQELDPELYARAAAQSVNLRASLNKHQVAEEARIKRLRESADPIAELLSEAEAAPKGERNSFLNSAAHWALEEKKFALCLDIIAKLDLDEPVSMPGFWRAWADQFLQNFVKAALAAKEAELAERGAGRIARPLGRVESLGLLMRFRAKAGDRQAARRLLDEAAKTADGAADNFERAKAFLTLSIFSDAADESAKPRLLEVAVKALDRVTRPDANARDRKPFQEYLRDLNKTGYLLSSAFRGLARKDEAGALGLSVKLQKPDLRAFALVGVLQGLDDSLAAAK
jgi:hypothetical protein